MVWGTASLRFHQAAALIHHRIYFDEETVLHYIAGILAVRRAADGDLPTIKPTSFPRRRESSGTGFPPARE